MPYRHDLVEISEPRIDQNGYLVADAYPTKVGVFKYTKPDGTVTRELRHEDDVFKSESMESLKNRPIVDEHQGLLNAGNTKHRSAGHVGETVEKVGDHVKANLIVTDSGLIKKMQGKNGIAKRELSCGYTADVVEDVGTYKGQQHDHRQTNIVYNHLAAVWKGRAGPTAQIHMDAEDALVDGLHAGEPKDEPPIKKEDAMTIKRKLAAITHGDFKTDAVEISYDDKSEQAVDVLASRADALSGQLAIVQDKYDNEVAAKKKVEGERDQAVEDAKKKKTDHAELDAMADVRADVKGVASHLGIKDYADKSNDEIKRMVVSAHNPDLKMDGLDEGNIEGRYGMICDGIRAENKGLESLAALKAASTPTGTHEDAQNLDGPSPRDKMIEDLSNMHGKSESQVKQDWAN